MSWDVGRVGSQGAEPLLLQLKVRPACPGRNGGWAPRASQPLEGRYLGGDTPCAPVPAGLVRRGGGCGGHPPGDLRETAQHFPCVSCIYSSQQGREVGMITRPLLLLLEVVQVIGDLSEVTQLVRGRFAGI